MASSSSSSSSAIIHSSIASTCDLTNNRRLGFRSMSFRRRGIEKSAKISASSSSSLSIVSSRSDRRRDQGDQAVAYEKLEEWMRGSVSEIVKNIRRAPLMVHVYGGDAVVEKAENWSEKKVRWESGGSPVPEGLIFVEELSDEGERYGDGDGQGCDGENLNDGVTKAFGVVVQGRGSDCPPVCYLLKTSEAGFGFGSGCGFGCTHFCLVRVNGFRETTESQLKNSWLR